MDFEADSMNLVFRKGWHSFDVLGELQPSRWECGIEVEVVIVVVVQCRRTVTPRPGRQTTRNAKS